MVGFSRLISSLLFGLFASSAAHAAILPVVPTTSFPGAFLSDNMDAIHWENYLSEVCAQYGPTSEEMDRACFYLRRRIPFWQLVIQRALTNYFLAIFRNLETAEHEFIWKDIVQSNIAGSSATCITAATEAIKIFTENICNLKGNSDSLCYRQTLSILKRLFQDSGISTQKVHVTRTILDVIAQRFSYCLFATPDGLRSPRFQKTLNRMESLFGKELAQMSAVRAITYTGSGPRDKNVLYRHAPTSRVFEDDFGFLTNLFGFKIARKILMSSAYKALRYSKYPVTDFKALQRILITYNHNSIKRPSKGLLVLFKKAFEDGVELEKLYSFAPRQYEEVLNFIRQRCGSEFAKLVERNVGAIHQRYFHSTPLLQGLHP